LPTFSGTYISGDLQRHILHANQVLNGSIFSYFPPYQDISDRAYYHYPFLTHASLATLSNVLNIHIFDSYFLLHLLQAFLLPIGIFLIVNRLTKNTWVSLSAVALTTLYGGHSIIWNSWWFNPAIERLVPNHLTRMLGLCFIPFFLYCFSNVFLKREKEFYLTGSTLILGYMGLFHTYPFVFIYYFLIIYFILNYKHLERKVLFAVLFIGLLISLIGYIPNILNLLNTSALENAGQLSENHKMLLFSQKIGQYLLTTKRFLIHYGIIGIFAICSTLFLRKANFRHFYLALTVTVLTILIATYFKEIASVFFNLRIPYHPTQQKFGKPIFLALIILSSFFLNRYMEWAKGFSCLKAFLLKSILLILLIGIGMNGFLTTLDFSNQGWFKMWGRAKANENFRKSSNIVNRIRDFTTNKDVVAVPEKIGEHFCHLSGLDVLYVWNPKTYTHNRKFANCILYASSQQRHTIEYIYDIKYAELVKWIIKKYGITFVIVTKKEEIRYDIFDFLKYFNTGNWSDGSKYSILRVEKFTVDESLDKTLISKINNFLGNKEAFQQIVGYYPLMRKRYLRPKLLLSMGLDASGLTWGDNALWLSYRNIKTIFKIDPNNGKILKKLQNPLVKPGSIAWDEEALWCIDTDTNKIYRIDPESGKVIKQISKPAKEIMGLAWGNGYLWTTYPASNEVTAFTVNGKVVKSISCSFKPKAIDWHENYLWVTFGRGRIVKVDIDNNSSSVYYSPSCVIESLVRSSESLWAFDNTSFTLVEFCKF